MGLVIIFFGFLWWLFLYLAVRLCFFLGRKYRLLAPEKSYKWAMRVIVLFLFFTPTYSSLVTSAYRLVTFPILCKEMAGYQKLNPVVPESFLEGPLESLALKETKFIEWEIKDNYRKKYAKRPDLYKNMPNLPLGLYRVEYLPEGSAACDLYKQAFSDPKIRHKKEEYMRNFEFRTRNIEGICLGITKINELKSKYQFKFFVSFPWEVSRFGYEVDRVEHQAVELFTGKKISTYVHLRTSWKRLDAFLFEYGQSYDLRCPKKGLSYWEVFNKFFIINEKKGIK